MGRFLVFAAVAAAVLFYVVHGHDASAAKVASCLQKAGAAVSQTRFLENTFGVTADGQQLPSGSMSALRRADKGNYDVELSGDTGLLMVIGGGYTQEQVQQSLEGSGGAITAQGSGRIVMYWTGEPSASARSTLDHCLH